MNQRALKLENSTKYAGSFRLKEAQMNQRLHIEATAADYNARKRTRQRIETSLVFHQQ